MNLGNGAFARPVHHKLHDGDFGDHKAFRQITGDFNGDGNLDLMVFNLGNDAEKTDVLFNPVWGLVAYVALGNGDGSFQDADGGQLAAPNEMANFFMSYRGLFIADFNGDGITDIGSAFVNGDKDLFTGPYVASETIVAFGSESGEFQKPIIQQRGAISGGFSRSFSGTDDKYHVADVNGDGVMDIVATTGSGNTNIMSFIGNGDGTFELVNHWELSRTRKIGTFSDEYQSAGDVEQGSCSTYGHGNIVADFNRDGYADVAYDGNNYYLGRGDGTFLYQGGVLLKENDTVKATGGGSTIDSFPIQDTTYGVYAVDANKDGATDILEVVVDVLGLKVGVIPNLIKPHQMKITSIDESGARHYAIEYDTIRNPNIYERTFEPDWPIRNLRDGKFVVKRVTTSNPTGGTHHFDYKYRDWLVDAEQKASDGFREVAVTDSRDETTTVKIFDQTYPRNGLLKEVKRTTKDGVLLWHESTSWDVEEYSYNTAAQTHTYHLVKRTGVLSRQFNSDGGLILETTTTHGEFDEFGMPWWTEMIRSDGYNIVTQNEYRNIDAWDRYIAGQVESVSETRTGRDLNDSITRQTRYEYYPNGLLHRTIEEPNDPDLYLVTEVEYYPNGMLKTKTVSGHEEAKHLIEPQVEAYVYTFTEPDLVNNRQYRTDITNAEDHSVSLFRSGLDHRVLKKTDENGLTTTFQYDRYGDLYLTTWPDKTKTQIARAQCDETCPKGAIYRVFTVKDGVPPKVQYFNIDEKEIRVATRGLNEALILQSTIYDAFGRVAHSTVPYTNHENPVRSRFTEYDILGRATKVVTPEEGTTNIRYYALDGDGVKVEKMQERQGITRSATIVTTQEQSANGDIRVVIDNERNDTFYYYDAFGNLARIEDAEGNETHIEYDDRGRKIRIADPDSGTLNLELDALGRLRRQEDAKGQVITWEYDKLNRNTMKITREGTNFWIYDTAVNGVGKIAQEGSGAGYQKTYMYDMYGRPEIVNHTWPDYSVEMITGYDTLGRLRSTTVAEDLSIFYSYDNSGRLERLLNYDPAGAAPAGAMIYWEAEEMYPDGRPKTVLLNDGALKQTLDINRYTGRMMWAATGDVLSNDFTTHGFAFDSLGNLEWRADLAHGIKEEFSYDALNRLKNVYVNDELTDSHNYDAIGNITSKSDFGSRYEYGENGAGPRAVTSVIKLDGSAVSYRYDANGNMTSGSGRSIDYSSENLPLQISATAATINFTYDANARRVLRREGV